MRVASPADRLRLECGAALGDVVVRCETFGRLDPDGSNAVLIAHALTGDARVTRRDHGLDAGGQPVEPPGWWEAMVGPGRAIDTDRWFVVCSNVLGGCSGTTGPTSIDPATGRRYAGDFPVVTIGDMVEAQARLLDRLGITRPVRVVGGSIGGYQALEWAGRFPGRVAGLAVLAVGARLSSFGLGFNAIGRNAIRADPKFMLGRYDPDDPPVEGLSVARQLAHLTYRTAEAFDEKFGRRTQAGERPRVTLDEQFSVEAYLRHQGRKFVRRFDANSYMLMTRAMDLYDFAGPGLPQHEADSAAAARFAAGRGPCLFIGFDSDWLFPPAQTEQLAEAARRAGRPVRSLIVPSRDGHDAFLLHSRPVEEELRRFLEHTPASTPS